MWYLALTMALGVAVAIHLGWKRRFRKAERILREQRQQLSSLEEEHKQIASRKQAEQEALFNSMAEGVLLLDRSGRI